jgi:hypothetical protein
MDTGQEKTKMKFEMGKLRYYELPELSLEEKKLPLSKYYYRYPLCSPPPLQQYLLDRGPMKPRDAVPAVNWLDSLNVNFFRKVVYGFCMMPDGSGYYTEYFVTPATVSPEMRRWFGRWINFRSKNMPPEQGNLRYKLWCPIDHWDHRFINGVDDSDGVWSVESLDLGKSGKRSAAVSHTINLQEYGLTHDMEEKLKAESCKVSAAWEEFEGPGHHLVLRLSHPCPFGGTENINQEWIGWYAKDGKIIRDEETPVDENYLKNVLTHNTVEHLHLPRFLPELYAEYHDKPLDAD